MEELRKKYEEEKLANLKKQEENAKRREEELVRMLVNILFIIYL